MYVWIAYEVLWLCVFFFLMPLVSVALEEVWLGEGSSLLTFMVSDGTEDEDKILFNIPFPSLSAALGIYK